MFPNGDTLYEYVTMRQQADRAHAARQRLAATAEPTIATRPVPLAVCAGLVRVFDRVHAIVRNAVAERSAARRSVVAERTNAGVVIA